MVKAALQFWPIFCRRMDPRRAKNVIRVPSCTYSAVLAWGNPVNVEVERVTVRCCPR
jgi:hypothetical protein